MYLNPYVYPYSYLYPHYGHVPTYNDGRQSIYWTSPHEQEQVNRYGPFRSSNSDGTVLLTDYGLRPFVVNINEATKKNNTYRTALWTGKHLQVTLMSLKVGEDIGLERHTDVDQFLRVEQGQGIVQMGNSPDHLNGERRVFDDSAIMIPAGTWHNIINTGTIPLKLYSIYAPPHHPSGTVHMTKEEAMAEEH